METMTIVATLAGVLAGVGITMALWWCFAREEGLRQTEAANPEGGWIALEPEPTQEVVRSFFAKLDAAERNVPVAMVATWKQVAAENMAAVKSAEEFAFEQGRMAAFCEMEKAYLEMAHKVKAQETEPEEE